MKLIYIILISIIGFQFNATSQDCSTSSQLTKGKSWVVSNYDKKDKFTGKIKYSVLEAKQDGDNYIWKIQQESFDKDMEPVNTGDYTITCANGDFEVDAAGLIPTSTLEMLDNLGSNIKVEMEQNTINYPASKDTGFQLKDGSVHMEAEAYGMKVVDLTVSILEREIKGLETITTDAGTYECVKINQILQLKDKRTEKNHPTKIWYLPGFGPIKSELYSPKGKLMEYSVVTSISE